MRKKIRQRCHFWVIEEGCTKTEIAEKIGVHFSTIYREIIRGGTPYSADEAQRRLTGE